MLRLCTFLCFLLCMVVCDRVRADVPAGFFERYSLNVPGGLPASSYFKWDDAPGAWVLTNDATLAGGVIGDPVHAGGDAWVIGSFDLWGDLYLSEKGPPDGSGAQYGSWYSYSDAPLVGGSPILFDNFGASDGHFDAFGFDPLVEDGSDFLLAPTVPEAGTMGLFLPSLLLLRRSSKRSIRFCCLASRLWPVSRACSGSSPC